MIAPIDLLGFPGLGLERRVPCSTVQCSTVLVPLLHPSADPLVLCLNREGSTFLFLRNMFMKSLPKHIWPSFSVFRGDTVGEMFLSETSLLTNSPALSKDTAGNDCCAPRTRQSHNWQRYLLPRLNCSHLAHLPTTYPHHNGHADLGEPALARLDYLPSPQRCPRGSILPS